MNKLKMLGALCVAFALVGLGYTLAPKPTSTVSEKIVYQDRIVEKAVAVDKTKTTKLPDGTLIVETDKTHIDVKAKEHKSEAVKSTTVSNPLPKYSIAGSLILNPAKPLSREYQIEMSKRLWNSPLSGTLGYQHNPNNPKVLVGLRLDF